MNNHEQGKECKDHYLKGHHRDIDTESCTLPQEECKCKNGTGEWKGICSTASCLLHTLSPQEESIEWEKEFDDKFPILDGRLHNVPYENTHWEANNAVKSFIKALLDRQVREIKQDLQNEKCPQCGLWYSKHAHLQRLLDSYLPATTEDNE